MVTRRNLLKSSILIGITTTGCQSVETQVSENELGDTVSRDNLSVTVDDSATAEKIHFFGQEDRNGKLVPPDNADLIIAKITVRNSDIESRDGPWFCIKDYKDTEKSEDEIDFAQNDILVYSGKEKGSAEVEGRVGTLTYDSMRVDGQEFNPYPYTLAGPPKIEADSFLDGWVYGVIRKEDDPRLRVDFAGGTSYWKLERRELSTPTKTPIVL